MTIKCFSAGIFLVVGTALRVKNLHLFSGDENYGLQKSDHHLDDDHAQEYFSCVYVSSSASVDLDGCWVEACNAHATALDACQLPRGAGVSVSSVRLVDSAVTNCWSSIFWPNKKTSRVAECRGNYLSHCMNFGGGKLQPPECVRPKDFEAWVRRENTFGDFPGVSRSTGPDLMFD